MDTERFGPSVLLCDFDGTIVNIDTAEKALDLFADPSWRRVEEGFERGEVSFEDSLRREYAMIRASPESILTKLDRITVLRPHFEKLVQYCKSNQFPLVVVSGGLDFCIQHFLGRGDWLNFITIHVPKARRAGNGYEVTFPRMFKPSSVDFKEDLVTFHKSRGERVFFIGNGRGDFQAAKQSNYAFAIRASKLAQLCKSTGVACKEIDDFQEVVDVVSNF
jgi:2-hydroxy-3-keto-5-methylthiopentenyl-1-phosphate phosphatase